MKTGALAKVNMLISSVISAAPGLLQIVSTGVRRALSLLHAVAAEHRAELMDNPDALMAHALFDERGCLRSAAARRSDTQCSGDGDRSSS